jgi:glycosyltransferase involved in cell wall biosynthesis
MMAEITPMQDTSLSIVIEWDNAKHCKHERSLAMLRALRRELQALAPPATAEVLILYDRLEVNGADVQATLVEVFGPAYEKAGIRAQAAEGLGYYELKNHGARQSTGEVVVFLDSDVVPDPGWLTAYVAAFTDPSVQVVAGATYVAPDNLYFKAFALYGDFPLAPPADLGLVPTQRFFANNMAARRQLLLTYPFPDLPHFRSQCRELARQLDGIGIKMVLQPKARVAHPPPNGFSHFVCQAVCDGHDWFLSAQMNDEARSTASVKGAYWRFRAALRRSLRRIRAGRRAVGLSAPGAVAAAMVAVVFFSCVFVGELLTRINPRIVRRHFAI